MCLTLKNARANFSKTLQFGREMMNVKHWLAATTEQERDQVAAEAGTTVGYLWQLSGHHRTPSPTLAANLEKASRRITPDRVMDRYLLVFGDEGVAA